MVNNVDVFWLELDPNLKDYTGERRGNAVRLKDYEALELKLNKVSRVIDKIYDNYSDHDLVIDLCYEAQEILR